MKRVDCQLITNDVGRGGGGRGDRRGGGMLRILQSLMRGGGGNQVNFNVTQLKSSKCPGDK